MTETLVENEICPNCDTEMPANAVFCYHCGNSIQPEDSSANSNDQVSDVWLRGDITETPESDENTEIPAEAEESETQYEEAVNDGAESVSEFEERIIEDKEIKKESDKRKISEKNELKSAASLRVKRLPPREVEVRWEEHENFSSVWFIIGTILLGGFALGALFLAMYLR